jgi:SAM-dependent methyltransferase
MLTVRYEQLGLRPGDLLLDLGAGLGRHAFEAYRRGARVIALDRSESDLRETAAMLVALDQEAGSRNPSAAAGVATGDALALPFADATFDRVISSEVFEHIADDRGAAREVMRVLKPGGTAAITVPTYLPELVCWALSSEYHAPLSVGGHVRIYRKGQLEARLRDAGFEVTGSHHAHALHSPYWWLRCAVGLDKADDNRFVRRYHDLLVKDMTEAPWYTRVPEKVLQPVLGKSLIVYLRKPVSSSAHMPKRSAA